MGVHGAVAAGVKGVLALVSVLVLSATGYGWVAVTQAEAGLAKSDVIDAGSSGQKGPGQDMNVLLVGVDSRTDAHGNPLPQALLDSLHAGADDGEIDTDTIIVVHVPGNGTAASAFSIPRDSYVDIAGQQGKDKINSAFQYGRNAEETTLRTSGVTDQAKLAEQGMMAGRKNLIQTVQKLTGVSIDHYAEVNLYGFAQISEAVGGVPVCLLGPTSDPLSGANFPGGHITVQGVTALEFVRQRHGPGLINELDRERRQQVFLAALARQMLSSGLLADPGKLSGIVTAIENSVVLDQDWNLVQFASEMQGLSGGSIKFNVMPVTDVDGNLGTAAQPNSVVFVSPSDVQAWAKALFSGTDVASNPRSASTTAAPTTSAPPANSATMVDVGNASPVSGLAARVLEMLVAKGYGRGEATTVASRAASLVEYAPDAAAAGQQLASALGDLPVAVDSELTAGHVKVLLGKDYRGPGMDGQSLTGGAMMQLAPVPQTATTTTTVSPDRPEINAGGDNCIA